MKKIILTLLLINIINLAFAQTVCTTYHRKSCSNHDGESMKYDSQSKSAILAKGQTSNFHMIAYKGLDYRITICAEENLGDQIQFKIYEKTRVLIKPDVDTQIEQQVEVAATEITYDEYTEDDYNDSYDDYSDAYSEEETTEKKTKPQYKLVKELLYDNASDSYSNKIEFTAEGPMSLIIEVIVPGGNSGGTKLKIRETGCVGVLIEHIKSRKVGF